MVSKNLQSKSMCIDTKLKELEGVMLFLKNMDMKGLNLA